MFDPVFRPGCRVLAAASAIGAVAMFGGAPTALAASPCPTPGTGVVTDFCLQPTDTTAGSDATLGTTIDFNYATGSDTVKNLTVTLAPGLLAIPTAVPVTCANSQLSAGGCPAGSQVGSGMVVATGRVILSLVPLTVSAHAAMYAMDPSACDAVENANPSINPSDVVACFGLDAWLGKSPPKPGTAPLISLDAPASVETLAGPPAAQFSFYGLPQKVKVPIVGNAEIQVHSLTLDIDGTTASASGGTSSTPFTRLPTSCAQPATTSLTVDTYSGAGDGTGTSSFTPTGCSALPFAPTLSASSTRDPGDLGASLTTTVSQPDGQAAAASIALAVPTATLAPDVLDAATSFGDVVGSATAVTPLLSAPLVGTVTLTGDIAAPTLTIALPSPVQLTLIGSLVLPTGTSAFTEVTFSGLPDVPLSSLTVQIDGGADPLWATTCGQPNGTINGTFTGQNGGPPVDAGAKLAMTGCPLPPEAVFAPVIPSSGGTPTTTPQPPSTTPTGPGKPPIKTSKRPKPPHLSGGSLSGLSSGHAKLRFMMSAGSSKLRSLTVGLPAGLAFVAKTYRRGVSVSGAKIHSLKLSHGRLVVSLRTAASHLRVTVSADAINEVTALRSRVIARKVKRLSVTVVADETNGHSASLRLTLRV